MGCQESGGLLGTWWVVRNMVGCQKSGGLCHESDGLSL